MSGGTPQQLPRSIRNCANHTNMDTIQCEAYAPKLRQRPPLTGIMGPQSKSVHAKPNRERSASRSRCGQSSLAPNMPGRCPNTVCVTNNRVRRENSVNSVIRKEVYTSADNPALVEVTVKTHGQQNGSQPRKQAVKSVNIGNRGEPWSKLLQQNNVLTGVVSDGNSFSHFDPLRTVHFLAEELQSKLQNNLSDEDHGIRQIISDMQQALHRVPPEIASTLGLSISPQNLIQNKHPASPIINGSFNYDYPTRDDMRQERLLGVVKGNAGTCNTTDRGSQTIKCRNMVLEPEKFQQHLEFSTAKIESACRQMEVVCSKLKTDKEELERELQNEHDLVLKLREQLDQTSSHQGATKQQLDQLETERNSLQLELQQLKFQLSGNTSQSQLLQQLQTQKTIADEQLASHKQQLTIAKMETEKYVAILAARDKQVTEIRSEMNQLQELVVEQLREIQTVPYSNSLTSCTTNATSKQSSSWLPTNKNTFDKPTTEQYELDRDIYKELAGVIQATVNKAGSDGGGSTTCNGGETTTATNSGVSSTTTIHKGGTSKDALTSKMVEIDLTADRDRRQSQSSHTKSNVAANLQNPSTYSGVNHQHTLSIAEQPQSVSIREMFAEIKKQALLINAAPQKQT